MVFITFNLEDSKFATTRKATKAVAYNERYHTFADEDIDYAKSAVAFMNESLHTKRVKMCYCKECKQPFFQNKNGIFTNCPQHTALSDRKSVV